MTAGFAPWPRRARRSCEDSGRAGSPRGARSVPGVPRGAVVKRGAAGEEGVPRLTRLLEALADQPARSDLVVEVLDALALELDCERIFLFRLRGSGGFRVLSARSRDRESISRPEERMSHHALRKMVAAGEPTWVADARRDRRYRTEEVHRGGRPAQSIIVLPLRWSGELRGGIYADHRHRALARGGGSQEPTRALLAVLACMLGLADAEKKARRRHAGSATKADARGAKAPEFAGAAFRPDWASLIEAGDEGLIELCGQITRNPDLKDIFDAIHSLEASTLPVLIRGETGVGKSALARAVHETSARRAAPFVLLHCGSLPEALVESELLGHVRGAFTGADSDRRGLFQEADGGTLLLDEVADLTQDVQTKLLRVLEDGMVRSVGAKTAVKVDVRVIASTHHDLDALIRKGLFREDLYFRLKGFVFIVPPLRDRREDILPLARRFLERWARDEARAPPVLSRTASLLLVKHGWPGNVRELENTIRRVVALGRQNVEAKDLALERRSNASGEPRSAEGARGHTLEAVVAFAEREAILAALKRFGGNKSQTAEFLRITRKSLYRRMARYGLQVADEVPGAE